MLCSKHNVELDETVLHGVLVYVCPKDGAIWFPEDSLRKAKDAEDNFLRWIDINPWADPKRFQLTSSELVCPVDSGPFYKTEYGDSDIVVHVCADHHGVWLEPGDFRAIIDWLHARIEQESFLGYLKDAGVQAAEIIFGKEGLASETSDFVIVAKLLSYRFLSHFPFIGTLIAQLPV